MTTPTRLVAIALAALLSILATPAFAGDPNNTGNINTGTPRQAGGNLRVKIRLKRGGVTRTFLSGNIRIGVFQTAEQKAATIRQALTADDQVTFGGMGNTVTATAINDWEIMSISLTPDSTREKDNISGLSAEFDLLCGVYSLGGTGSGFAEDGTPGFASITVGGFEALVPTFAGMSAPLLEDLLITELINGGIDAALGVPADDLEFFGLEGDGNVIRFTGIDAFGVDFDLKDEGFIVDVAGIYKIPAPGTFVLIGLAPVLTKRRRRR